MEPRLFSLPRARIHTRFTRRTAPKPSPHSCGSRQRTRLRRSRQRPSRCSIASARTPLSARRHVPAWRHSPRTMSRAASGRWRRPSGRYCNHAPRRRGHAFETLDQMLPTIFSRDAPASCCRRAQCVATSCDHCSGRAARTTSLDWACLSRGCELGCPTEFQ